MAPTANTARPVRIQNDEIKKKPARPVVPAPSTHGASLDRVPAPGTHSDNHHHHTHYTTLHSGADFVELGPKPTSTNAVLTPHRSRSSRVITVLILRHDWKARSQEAIVGLKAMFSHCCDFENRSYSGRYFRPTVWPT